jgi:hypothetical protein
MIAEIFKREVQELQFIIAMLFCIKEQIAIRF